MSVNNFPATFDLATPSFVVTNRDRQVEVFGNFFTQSSPEVGVLNPFKTALILDRTLPTEFVYLETFASIDWNNINEEYAVFYQGKTMANGLIELEKAWSNLWIEQFKCPFVIVYDCRVDWFPHDSTKATPSESSYLRWTFKILPFTLDPTFV